MKVILISGILLGATLVSTGWSMVDPSVAMVDNGGSAAGAFGGILAAWESLTVQSFHGGCGLVGAFFFGSAVWMRLRASRRG